MRDFVQVELTNGRKIFLNRNHVLWVSETSKDDVTRIRLGNEREKDEATLLVKGGPTTIAAALEG